MDEENNNPIPEKLEDSDIDRSDHEDYKDIKLIKLKHEYYYPKDGITFDPTYSTSHSYPLEISAINLKYKKVINGEESKEQLIGLSVSSHKITPLYFPRGSTHEIDLVINKSTDADDDFTYAYFSRSTDIDGDALYQIELNLDEKLFEEIKSLVLKDNLDKLSAKFYIDPKVQDTIYHHHIFKDILVDEKGEYTSLISTTPPETAYDKCPTVALTRRDFWFYSKNKQLDARRAAWEVFRQLEDYEEEDRWLTGMITWRDDYVSKLSKRVSLKDRDPEEF